MASWFGAAPPPPPPATLFELYLSHESWLHRNAAALMVVTGLAVIFVELGIGTRAAYGRYAEQPAAAWYGPKLSAKACWIFQECWSFLVPLILLLTPGAASARCLAAPANRVLLLMYMSHYLYRAFIFPMRMRGGKPMPLVICLFAAAFCLFNGWLQGRAWTHPELVSLDAPADVARFGAGVAIWAAGLCINYHSDGVLRNLRKPGETGYKIPRGGAFALVSGANYFGEIVEWIGYGIAAARPAALAFAFFTFANTAPRAYHHHLWYRAKFDDYPPERRAVIPYVW